MGINKTKGRENMGLLLNCTRELAMKDAKKKTCSQGLPHLSPVRLVFRIHRSLRPQKKSGGKKRKKKRTNKQTTTKTAPIE